MNTTAEPAVDSLINNRMDKMYNQLSVLAEFIANLRNKLMPVLTEDPDKPESPPETSSETCPLARTLSEQHQTLETSCSNLQDVINRIQL